MTSLLKFYNICFTFSLIGFKDTGENPQEDCVTLTTPPLGVNLHINFLNSNTLVLIHQRILSTLFF